VLKHLVLSVYRHFFFAVFEVGFPIIPCVFFTKSIFAVFALL